MVDCIYTIISQLRVKRSGGVIMDTYSVFINIDFPKSKWEDEKPTKVKLVIK